MMCRRIGGTSVAVCVLLTSVWPCSAAVIQWQQVLPFDFASVDYVENGPIFTFPPTTHVESQTLHFAPFDPSLGTLNNAFLSYEGTYGVEYVVKAGLRPLTAWESANNYTLRSTRGRVGRVYLSSGLDGSGRWRPSRCDDPQ